MNSKQLWELALDQFQKRSSLMLLWQEIAENFFPERADFTYTRTLGTDFASNLMTSYPVLCRRDLGDQLGTMLRPKAKPWFHPGIRNRVVRDNETMQKLQEFEAIQRNAMYDRDAQLTRATKQGDHDFAAFGQCAISVEMNWGKQALLYKAHHLRDVTWTETENGEIGNVFRKWKPQARELMKLYPKTHDERVARIAEKTPFETIECGHMVVEAEQYNGDIILPGAGTAGRRGQQPRFLICYDAMHDRVLEAIPIWNRHYLIPRWSTPGQSQFAYSPATVAALADARLIQAMTLTLLEAGEKITNPPMVATQEAVRSDINIYPGGVTWVDIEYDENLGEALRPLTTDAKGMPIGIDMMRDARQLIMQAFYLNKLNLPIRSPEMTAYEVGQRIQQYIRDALPIFEPMEMEYNGALCEETFELLWRNGAFGSPRDWPRSIQGADISWTFESPLHDAIEQQKGQKFLEMIGYVGQAVTLDPNSALLPDAIGALRDVLIGIGAPAKWVRPEGDVEDLMRKKEEEAEAMKLLGAMESASKTAQQLGQAKESNAAAEAPSV